MLIKRFILVLCMASVIVSACMAVEVQSKESQSTAVIPGPEDVPAGKNGDQLSLEVGIEPTPLPAHQLYSSADYGYQLDYPETWSLEELDHGVELTNGDARMLLFTWWAADQNPPTYRSGLPAGDVLYRDKLTFLGEILPVHYLVYEEKTKQVFFNNGEATGAGELLVYASLEGKNPEYESIDLSSDLIADAVQMLESFKMTSQAAPPEDLTDGLCATNSGAPPGDWQLFQNEEYGFFLYHPPAMEVVETGDHILEFQEDDLVLRMEFRGIDQAYPLPGIIPEGEVELTRFVEYFGEENLNPIVVERSGGMITRVMVGNVFGRTTPVQFHVVIAGPTGMEVDLDKAEGMLEILDTLCLGS